MVKLVEATEEEILSDLRERGYEIPKNLFNKEYKVDPNTSYKPTSYERRVYFRRMLLNRIQDRIGLNNIDQKLKEEILPRVCSKMTAIWVGAFDKLEQSMGRDVWAYKVENEIFNQFSMDEQDKFKRNAALWKDCRLTIKELGNTLIDEVIDILSSVIFVKKDEDTNE